jgi:hypothetical protein
MASKRLFPHSPYGMSGAFRKDDIQIDGMKVQFDKVADLVPAELTVKSAPATTPPVDTHHPATR